MLYCTSFNAKSISYNPRKNETKAFMDYYLENMTANCVCGSRNTIICYQESYSQFGVIGVVFSIELVTPVKGIKIQSFEKKMCFLVPKL